MEAAIQRILAADVEEEYHSDDQRDYSDFDRSNEHSMDRNSLDESTEDGANSVSEIEYSDGTMEGEPGGEVSDGTEDNADGPSVSKDTIQGKVGFLEGGKMESFSRAFARLVKDDRITAKAPILSGSNTILMRQKEEEEENEMKKAARRLKREMRRRGHVVPRKKGTDPGMDAKEKQLQKTATKGVVQLFNAINAAQKRIQNEETKGNKAKIAKLGKASFLAEIRHLKEREISAKQEQRHEKPVKESTSGWDVLREGFVGIKDNVKMKDWDATNKSKEHVEASHLEMGSLDPPVSSAEDDGW